MSVHHLSSDVMDPQARGAALGRRTASAIDRNYRDYLRLFDTVGVERTRLPEVGVAAVEHVATWFPRLLSEWRGLAAGAGIELWQVGVLNARTEILASVGAIGEGECTTAVFVPAEGPPHSIQTWDWHDEFDSDRSIVSHPCGLAVRLRYFTEAGLTGKIGIAHRRSARDGRAESLGLHLNILNHRSDGDGIGVPVHVVARRLLEEATAIDEAIDIARSADVSSSTALTVVSHVAGNSEAACIELCPDGVAIVRPDGDGFLVHTNHFLDPGLARGELSPVTSSTFARRAVLGRRRHLLRSPVLADHFEFLHRHESDGGAVCCHPDPRVAFQHRWGTLITIDLDYVRPALHYTDSGPCQHEVNSHQTL